MKSLFNVSVLALATALISIGSVETVEARTDTQKTRGVARRTARRTARRQDKKADKKEQKSAETPAATAPTEMPAGGMGEAQ